MMCLQSVADHDVFTVYVTDDDVLTSRGRQ